MLPELTDVIESVLCPSHRNYRRYCGWTELSLEQRTAIRKFCRQGLAALGLQLPTKYRGDYVMLACNLRAFIIFGDQREFNGLAMGFHPDSIQRKAAAEARGYLFDEHTGRAILDYGGDVELDGVGYRAGTA